MAAWLAALALAHVSALRVEAAPAPVRVAALIAVVLGDDRGDAHSSMVNARVADAFRSRLGVRLVSSEELFVAHGQISNAVQSCGADARCTSSELRKVGADLGLIAVVNLVVEPPLISLRLVDASEERVVGVATDSSRPGPEAISEALRTQAGRLLDEAGFSLGARITFDTMPAGAHVEVQGFEAELGAPNVFFLPPGTYLVRAMQDGFSPFETSVTLVAGESRHHALELSEDTTLFESPWFWIGLGAVVAGATATAIVLSAPRDRCICVALPGAPCPPC